MTVGKNVYAVWGAVGAAALLTVIVVGFVIPLGADRNAAVDAPMTAPAAAPDAGPATAVAPLDREDKAELREKWANMSEADREHFRQDVRARLAESRRLALEAQARVSREQDVQQAQLAKQRQERMEAASKASGDNSQVQVK